MTTESLRNEVEELLNEAAKTLSDGLEFYWPTSGETGAHESNISLYVGHTLLESGRYFVFGESHRSDAENSKQRFDLVAVARDQSHVVACEFKQLWTPSRAESMKADFHRLNKFKPLPWYSEGVPVVGVIAAFATQEKLAMPFSKDGQRDGLVTQCDLTQQFCQELPESRGLGCVPLFAGRAPSLHEPAFVYAVFEIAPGAAASSNPQH
jgi:hypothetical protein